MEMSLASLRHAMFEQNNAISVVLVIGPHRAMLCFLISRHFSEKHLFSLS